MSACECGACGRGFTGVTTFDAHQDVNYARIPAVICRDPVRLGMVTDRHGRWMRPASEADRARLATLQLKSGSSSND